MMQVFVIALVLLLRVIEGHPKAPRADKGEGDFDFNGIQASAELTWKPCFSANVSCSRLEVPLDHSNKSIGTTSIAFVRYTGSQATAASKSIVLLPGGPGNSGIDLLLSSLYLIPKFFGEEYNIVSFDPRGVNNSGPFLDCFSGNPSSREVFQRLHNTGVTNTSSVSLEEQFYSSSIYGDWCNHAVETNFTHGFYVTTPAVARDLLSFIEAEAVSLGQAPTSAKMWAYAVSYGTVTGATFASMFPDRVERMILDGIVDADLYYRNDYSANLDQVDETMAKFSSLCYSAGPSKCAFWGPTPQNITARLNNIIEGLLNKPVPIANAQDQGTPVMVTYSDLKALLLINVYHPITGFPTIAEILHQIENGNFSGLVGEFKNTMMSGDTFNIIGCADAYRTNSIRTFEDFRNYVKTAIKTSKYLGDIWPITVDTMLCRTLRPNLPDSMVIQNTTVGTREPTAFPILFTSNTVDPITPLISARRSSARFPGSKILLQDGIGHTVALQGPTDCYIQHVQAYYKGIVPATNTTCAPQYVPFIDNLG